MSPCRRSPNKWGRLPKDGGHLGFGIGRAVPHEAFAPGIDPDGGAVEGVEAAPAGRVTRIHQARGIEQLMIKPGQGAAGIPSELEPAALRVDPGPEENPRATG